MLADARLIAHKPKTLSMREAAALDLSPAHFKGLSRLACLTLPQIA
jgi:hypothetical protein